MSDEVQIWFQASDAAPPPSKSGFWWIKGETYFSNNLHKSYTDHGVDFTYLLMDLPTPAPYLSKVPVECRPKILFANNDLVQMTSSDRKVYRVTGVHWSDSSKDWRYLLDENVMALQKDLVHAQQRSKNWDITKL